MLTHNNLFRYKRVFIISCVAPWANHQNNNIIFYMDIGGYNAPLTDALSTFEPLWPVYLHSTRTEATEIMFCVIMKRELVFWNNCMINELHYMHDCIHNIKVSLYTIVNTHVHLITA